MMNVQDQNLWQALVDAEARLVQARMDFSQHAQNRTGVLREALYDPGQRGTALRILLNCSPVDERAEVFTDLIALASVGHSDIGLVRDVILSLPKNWIVANIEQAADPILHNGGEEEYRRLLELYALLDPDLTARLAARASASQDPEIHEAGDEFS